MNTWLIVGFLGQLFFSARFFVQWICSERRKESYIPVIFWYLSLCGGGILFLYAIHIKDPVFILGQSMGLVIYLRNLSLISQTRARTGINAQDTP